ADAIEFGHHAIIEIVGMIEELQKKAGREKVGSAKLLDPGLLDAVRTRVEDKIREVKGKPGKSDRSDAVRQVMEDLITSMAPAVTDPNASYLSLTQQRDEVRKLRQAFVEVEEQVTRETILSGVRPDGRGFKDIRPISIEVGLIPRVHGSALFSRGETQSLCSITLGTSSDEQMVDGLIEEYSQKFMLHYNFPSYSVGEVRPIRGADGCGRADFETRRGNFRWSGEGRRQVGSPHRHPRRRGSFWRYGFQSLRHARWHHRDPARYQDRRHRLQDHSRDAASRSRSPDDHHREDERCA